VELVVGGDGDDRARYEDMVRRLGLGDQVAFRGWVDADERRQLLASAMATVVYPTTANDALPTVICESWEAGTPVIVAAIGALPSIVTDGDAVVVEPSKPRLLAEALRALAEDTERAERMGKAGRARVEAEFNWENQVTQIERLLRGLAHNEHARERT
jgi:glycosyltransferase involved in cell wall biosynthesis